MQRCPKCRREVDEEVSYCPNCGTELRIKKEALEIRWKDARREEKMGWVIIGASLLVIFLGIWFYTLPFITNKDFAIMIIAIGSFCTLFATVYYGYASYKRSKLMERFLK